MTAVPAPASARRSGTRAVLVVALVLTGLSMRTAATSVGPALKDLQHGLHASGAMSGLITTLPVICFAIFGALTPRMSRAVGAHRLLMIALAVTTFGLVVRPIGSSSELFALVSVLALGGGAVSNVLMPSLVKAHFPDRIGAMTAVYTTALAVGGTAAAGFTVPIGDVAGGWRVGLGSWAVLSAVAVVPWLTTLRADRTAGRQDEAPRLPLSALLHSRTAWLLAVYFGTQSLQAYIAFGWFARYLSAHGITDSTAGVMVALLSALGIPMSMLAPRVPQARQRWFGMGLVLFYIAAYVGMALAPNGGAWVWMVIAGIGNGTFPFVLTLIGTRARTAEATATLSAFVQAIGYVIAGSGPLLFGALYGATGSWALPMTVLFVALGVMTLVAWPSLVPRFVDDEIRDRAPSAEAAG